ncbi:MAG TPA: FHA domain-containing protein [Gaiellaceae bacterium]|nr:FHA domain-containing protein [Gaiellaceae bacterium]
MTVADSISVDELLLILKLAFLVLLYLFIWRIVRTASRELDVGAPRGGAAANESILLSPGQASALGLGRRASAGEVVVVRSPVLQRGRRYALDSAPLTIGRGGDNDLELRGDQYASAQHARIEPRGADVWVEDDGSTNGTYVNGTRIEGPHRLRPGDVVRIGETELRYEEG